jgi:hypothetical protein
MVAQHIKNIVIEDVELKSPLCFFYILSLEWQYEQGKLRKPIKTA